MREKIVLIRFFIISILLWGLSPGGSAQDAHDEILVLSKPDKIVSLGKHLEYMFETGEPLTPDYVKNNLASFDWTPSPGESAELGDVVQPVWFHLRFKTDDSLSGPYIVNFRNSTLDVLDAYLFEDDVIISTTRAGATLKFSERSIYHMDFLAEINLKPNQSYDYLIRVESTTWLDLPTDFSSYQLMITQAPNVYLKTGVIYGVLLGLIVYNLLIFVTTRVISYLLLVPMVLSSLLFLMTLDQLAFKFLWPEAPALNAYSIHSSVLLFNFFCAVFSWDFLKLRESSRGFRLTFIFIAVVSLILSVTPYLINFPYVTTLVGIVMPLSFFTYIFIGVYFAIKGNSFAKYYLTAWLPLTAVFIWMSLSILEIFNIPIDPIWDLLRLSMCALLLLLSLAQGARLKQLEREKEEALAISRAKSDMVARVSHEIRTPMNGILGMSNLLRDRLKDDEAGSQYNEIVHQSATTLLGVINDLLDLAKVESDKMEVENISFDLRKLVEETAEFFNFQANDKSINLRVELDDSIPPCVEGDPTRIRQVLFNLMSNAIKFTENGEVKVTVKQSENKPECIDFEVSDTGSGISAEKLDSLFDAFTQESVQIVRKYGGSGLGLYISKRLVELMGGEINVASEQGKGTTFHVLLPLQESTDKNLAEQSEQNLTVSAGNLLIVEDNKINQMVVEKLLTKMGHNIIMVENGEEAVEYYHHHHAEIDLILMDCEMPVMDGYEATRQIRAFELENQLTRKPIVALTAHALVGHRELCIEAGMDEQMSKPIQVNELNAQLAKLIL